MPERRKKAAAGEGYEWVRALVSAVVALVLLFTFALRIIRVDGESMRETLQDGDMLVAVSRHLAGEMGAGDIVILRNGAFDPQPIVKRVVATAGQTVDIDFSAGTVYVDGLALEEPYVREPTHLDQGLPLPLTVPEGSVFVLGDNRNHSKDSRHPELGAVDLRYIIGKAVFLAVPGKTAETENRDLGRIGPLG